MVILGLTGSIAMGKSTAAAMFRRLGVPVYDADHTVHRLLGIGGAAVPLVEERFPGVVREGRVDRDAVARRVFGDPAALKDLEAILHPLVRLERQRFLERRARLRSAVVVLDIPLLFETGGERHCDAVVVVTAPAFLQIERLLRRPGMSLDRALAIRARQMSDREKRKRGDFVVPSGLGRAFTFRVIRSIVAETRSWRGRHWPQPGSARSRPRPVREKDTCDA